MPSRGRSLAAGATVTVAVLTSCASPGGFNDLNRERLALDAVPEVVTFPGDVDLLSDSSRLVGSHEGAEVWLARTADDGACLLVYPNDRDWAVGCSDNLRVTVEGATWKITAIPDSQPPPADATRISHNVFVR